MILRLENQQEIHISFGASNSSTMFVRSKKFEKTWYWKWNLKKKYNDKSIDQHCDHCNATGHTRDICSKLHGYPDLVKRIRKLEI